MLHGPDAGAKCAKRKFETDGNGEEEETTSSRHSLEAAATSKERDSKRRRIQSVDSRSQINEQTPRKSIRSSMGLLTPEKTPTKLTLEEGSPNTYLAQSTTPRQPEISPLLCLHKAILRSLTLHIAHHGTSSSIRLANLLPSASKIWGTRNIDVEDVQRCMGLHDLDNPPFRVFNYGRAGVCLELSMHSAQGPSQGRAVLAQPLDENALHAAFARRLEAAWESWSSNETSGTWEDFEQQLDRVNIPEHPSLLRSRTGSSSLGQQRLNAILRTPQKRQPETQSILQESSPLTPATKPPEFQSSSPPPKTASAGPETKLTPKDRKQSLYDRLVGKASATALAGRSGRTTLSMASGDCRTADRVFTPAQKSAMSHLPSIVATLTLLGAGSGGRQAFSLAQLVRRIKESSKSILGEDEVREALGLLGGARFDARGRTLDKATPGASPGLAPEFVKTVRIGDGVLGIVVDVGAKPLDMDARIKCALHEAGADS